MHIKGKLLAAMLALTATCQANYYYYPCHYFDGFYVGIAGGVANNVSNNTVTTEFIANPATPAFSFIETSTVRGKNYQSSPWGEIYGGWGRQWDCGSCWGTYLGARLGVNFSKFDVQVHNEFALEPDPAVALSVTIDGETTLKSKLRSHEFTFDLKPGIIFYERSMLFALIGGAVNEVKFVGESAGVTTTFLLPARASKNNSQSKQSVALRLGLGMEQFITEHLSLQASYVYTQYWKLKYYGITTTGDIETAFIIKPSKQVASLGLSYYF